jgi:DNA-directed RNA polymerase, beta'' subunit/160 kD subunit
MDGIIKKIKFERLTDQQLEVLADCRIERLFNNTFSDGSIYDRHMGVCDRGKYCETCSCDWEGCVGGFGIIKLPTPYYFDNIRTIIKTLNSTCKKCNKIDCLCKPKSYYKFTVKKCKDKTKLEYEFFEEQKFRSLSDIYKLLTIPLMNYNIVVTPIYTRGYLTKSGQNLYNDISTIYNSVVKELSREDINHREVFDKIEMLLTQKKKKLLPNSSKVPLSIQEKIQGKDGLINSNVNGKRVNHSARANITGFPEGNLGEIGIPKNMAKKMTILESLHGINDYTEWINKNKPLRVKKQNGKTFRFTPQTTSNIIQYLDKSDYIERPLRDGDIVLFNRQPSLRPESIIAKRVKIIDSDLCNTLRLTLPCTPPLNADFDGDECNIHVLQDLRAMVECYELMNPSEQIISSQKGTPLFVPVQDALIGLYIITEKNCTIAINEIHDVLFCLNRNYEFLEKKIDTWNRVNQYQLKSKNKHLPGQFVFSLLINEHFYFRLNDEFIIENGIVKSSSLPLTKRILSGGFKSLIHKYYFSIGKWETCALIDYIQVLTNYYLARHGFTIGLTDCIMPLSSYKNNPVDVNTVLGRIEVQLSQLNNNNNLYKIVLSGAKGSMTNIVQISQLVGQQSIDGTKVKSEMTSERTLVYSKPFSDQNYQERGFVKSSFYEGLTKSENIFHAKAGRRGVTDSVTKVSESGYTSKKICKFIENQIVEYDLSVRNNETKRIVQFLFGSDGMNPQQLPSEDGKKSYLTTEDFVLLNLHKASCLEESVSIFTFSLNKISLGLRKNNLILDNLLIKILNQGLNILSKFVYDADNKIEKTESELVTVLHCLLFKRLFQPGTAIGAICGTNFGEIASQLLLKSFHHSGIKNKDISGGIKRLNQLLNRTCSPENEIICVSRIDEKVYNVFRESRKIVDDDFSKRILLVLMEIRCNQLMNKYLAFPFSFLVISSIFKNCECFKKNCSIFSNICGKAGPYNILYELDLSKLEGSIDDVKINLSETDNEFVIIEPSHIKLLTNINETDQWDVIRKLVSLDKLILNVNLTKGNITNSYIEYEESIDDYEIIFKGTKLQKILELPFIDIKNIYSTDPFENINMFGIEAGRYSLFKEIQKVLSFDGADIDFRYLDLVCDSMCCDGKIVSIVNSPGVLTNSLFEKEIKKLTVHSINKSVDNCESVEACVFLGKLCKMGTGFIDLCYKK